MLTHGILAAIPTSYFSSHSLAPFSEHPLRHRVLESPLQAWQPRSIFPGYPYPRSSGISTDGFTPPVHPGYLPLSGMQDPPQQRVQPQNTMPGDLNLEGSAVTYPQGIPRFLPPRDMVCKEPFLMDGNHKVRCQMIHISLVLAYQPIPTPQLIRKCLPSWNAEIPAVWISFAKCKSKLSASSI